jgi:hypothetical protein
MDELKESAEGSTDLDPIVIDEAPTDLAELLEAARAALDAADAHLRRRERKTHWKSSARLRTLE